MSISFHVDLLPCRFTSMLICLHVDLLPFRFASMSIISHHVDYFPCLCRLFPTMSIISHHVDYFQIKHYSAQEVGHVTHPLLHMSIGGVTWHPRTLPKIHLLFIYLQLKSNRNIPLAAWHFIVCHFSLLGKLGSNFFKLGSNFFIVKWS